MEIKVYINDVDRTNVIRMGSLFIRDEINNATDTCDFSIAVPNKQNFTPDVNADIRIEIDGTPVYGGVLVRIEQIYEDGVVLVHNCKCKDYTQYLDRELIVERYENTNLKAVIDDLIDRYADDYGFTGNNVSGSTVSIKSVSFNELTMSQALQKLAKLTGYYWYVDYEKDIHFFKKNTELAPFNLTDTSNNFIFDSLEIASDISQLRNIIKVEGGQAVSEPRTENYAGNGEQTTFPLGSKFAELPVVEVDGVAQTVGVDHLQDPDDYDCMWSFQQKYIKFNPGHIPPAPGGGDTTNIEVTGNPLIPIIVKKQNSASITKYGPYMFKLTNDSLNTRDEALQFAQTELNSYAEKIREGKFKTYNFGLRSGQVINVASLKRDINEKLLIQSVDFSMISTGKFVWEIQVATLKTIGMIDLLQEMLLEERISEGDDETLTNFFDLADNFSVTDSLTDITVTTSQDYVWEQVDPGSDSYGNPGVWDQATWDT